VRKHLPILTKVLKIYQLEGGIIEYTRQIKEEGLQSKFIGKNFVLITAWGKNY
jgi:predicted sulfurtransferase